MCLAPMNLAALTAAVKCYQQADVILLCYDIQKARTFARLHSLWLPELAAHAPHTPVILVGLKEDQRGNLHGKEGVDIADGDQVQVFSDRLLNAPLTVLGS